MAKKTVIYCKQNGGLPIPVTVRIEWLPDGAITPLMYWTPDGTCCKIVSQLESVQIAYLRERGVGLRIKVTAEIIETPERDDELLRSRCETYLYLADDRFSQKNIIDERYAHAGKEYIPVTLDVFPDGGYELIYFGVRQGRYKVEKTVCVEPRGSYAAGGIGLWHKVEARLVNLDDDEDPDPRRSVRRQAALYLELNKWFVRVAKPA